MSENGDDKSQQNRRRPGGNDNYNNNNVSRNNRYHNNNHNQQNQNQNNNQSINNNQNQYRGHGNMRQNQNGYQNNQNNGYQNQNYNYNDRQNNYNNNGGGGGYYNNRRGGNNNRAMQPRVEETELTSELVQINAKRFYIDVKENPRGRYFKLTELGSGGRKSRIMLSMAAAIEFKEKLAAFNEANDKLPVFEPKNKEGTEDKTTNNEAAKPSAEESVKVKQEPKTPTIGGEANNEDGTTQKEKTGKEGVLKSDTLIKDHKRYYLDLKENERGRFLRISMVINRGPRAQIAIPAEGLAQFATHYDALLTQYNNVSEEELARAATALSLYESKALKTDNKSFFFDIASNTRGTFLKISEVRANQFRTSITVPGDFIEKFRDHLTQFIGAAAAEAAAQKDKAGQNEGGEAAGSSLIGKLGNAAHAVVDAVKSAVGAGEHKETA